MTENTIGSTELRIVIEAGDEYAATPRLIAALDELEAALIEIDENDTGGFSDLRMGSFSLTYLSPNSTSWDISGGKASPPGWKIEEGVKFTR